MLLVMSGWAADIVPETPKMVTGATDDDWELYTISIDGGPVRRLTTDAVQSGHPRVSPDGRWLLYEQSDDARKESSLFLRGTLDADGRLLTGIISASFTPDSRLLFTENIPAEQGTLESWFGVMACDGTEKQLYRQGKSPKMSPDGKNIAFTDLQGNVLLIDAEGKAEAVSLGKGVPCAFNHDGSMLAVSREYRMGNSLFNFPVVHVLTGKEAGSVYEVPEAERRNREHCWGFVADGRLLCTRDGDGIFLANPQRHTLTWITRSDDWAPGVTPDGAALVFLRLRGQWAQLCRINLDGSHFTPVTSALVDTPNYTLTPDGKTIIFSAIPRQGYDAATLVTREPLAITPYPPAVIKHNGVGLVPLRYLAEQIGAEVAWDAVRKRVSVARRGKEYGIAIPPTGSSAVMKNDTLFVSVRELIEALGGGVSVSGLGDLVRIDLPGLGHQITMPMLADNLFAPNHALFLFSLDGGARQLLTFSPRGSAALPLVSPHGQWIVAPGQQRTIYTGQYVYMPAKSGITIRRADDPTERRLLPRLPDNSGYADLVFSPDGTKLLFTRKIEVRTPGTEGGLIAWYSTYRDELGAVTLADGVVRELGDGREGVFSPDGARIAFVRGNEVWVANIDGTGAQRICNGFAPRFTPDGTGLLVHRFREEMSPDERAAGINASLLLCRLDSEEERRLGLGTLAGFSADGKFLYAWESRVRPEQFMMSISPTGAKQRVEHTVLRRYALDAAAPAEVVLTGAFRETALGTTHAAGVSENAELHAASLTGGPARVLAKGDIRAPSFTPDGRYVLFIKDGDLCLINADGGDIARVTWGVTVEDYNLTPDGAHLLVYGRQRE